MFINAISASLFAQPLENIVRLHVSSATTGKPVVAGYTKNDIETWAEVIARTMTYGDCRKNDVVQNSYGYGLTEVIGP